MSDKILVTRAEFEQGLGEQVANIIDVMDVVNQLKKTVNTQAEVLGLYRFIFERFFPAPQLTQAIKDFKQQREQMIAAESEIAQGKGN